MAKPRSVDAKLARLRELRHEPAGPELLAELRAALGERSNLVVARAAEVVGERGLADLAPELAAAFDRFMTDPAETDKLCLAKVAIVDALNKVEADEEAVFLRGIRHVQMEPRWGGKDDSAAPLRSGCAFGLVRSNYRGAPLLLADLLADREKVARVGAAHALGESRLTAAVPLLRYKARVGDSDLEVTAACLTALLTAAPEESVPFVAEFLDAPNEAVQEGAALALGESRRPDALEALKARLARARYGSPREALLLAVAMTRLPEALTYLLEALASDDADTASAALDALAIHRHNESIKARVADVMAKKGGAGLRESYRRKFEASE
jgi:HEAT repeat protein